MALWLLTLCRPSDRVHGGRGDGLTVAVAGQHDDQDPLHAAAGDELPAAGLGGDVGQVQGPGQPRIARCRAAAQVEPHLAVVAGGRGGEQRQLRAAAAAAGRRRVAAA